MKQRYIDTDTWIVEYNGASYTVTLHRRRGEVRILTEWGDEPHFDIYCAIMKQWDIKDLST